MNNSFNDLFANRSIRFVLVAVLALLALFLFAQFLSVMTSLGRSGVPATDTITVQGQGQATMAPDVARISFTVENSSPTVADAQTKTTEQTNAALSYLEEQGIDEKDIRTMYYNISPQYSYPNPCPLGSICPDYIRQPKITGYQVSQSVEVTVRDLAEVGTLLNGLGMLQVQNVSGPAFALDDPTAGYDAARAEAIEKAQAEAKRIARALGVGLGKVVSFNESSGGYPYPIAYGMGGGVAMKDSAANPPSIPTGENTYNASVSITYEIR